MKGRFLRKQVNFIVLNIFTCQIILFFYQNDINLYNIYFNLIVSCIEIMNYAKVRVKDSKVRRVLSLIWVRLRNKDFIIVLTPYYFRTNGNQLP